MSTSQLKRSKKIFTGVVVSRSEKTLSVRIDRDVEVKKYHTKVRVSKKFAVHDPANSCAVGQTVSFVETRPLSKRKRWIVVSQSNGVSPSE